VASTLDSTFRTVADRFVPERLHAQGDDAVRRARLTLGAVGAVLICSSITLLWLLVSHPERKPYPLLALTVGCACVPFVVRQTGSLQVAGHSFAALTSITLGIMMLRTGAATYPPFAVLPAVPMLAMLIAGTRAGVVWALVSGAQVAVFYALFRRGLSPVETLPDAFVAQGRFIGAGLMVVFVLLITYCYERLKKSALEDLVSERRRQVELRDRFLSHVSHELRTPVAAAEQFVSLVLDGVVGKISDEQAGYLEGAMRNTKELVAMIDDLVVVSRARSGDIDLEVTDLSVEDTLQDVIRRWDAAGMGRGVELSLAIEDALPPVRAHAKALGDVVERLLDNALRFSPDGGHVRILANRSPDGGVRIAVSDEGPGVEPERMESIFEGLESGSAPEWRSRKGLGVGLAIAREFVHAMGGRIRVQSRSGGGSEFNFTLPGADNATT